MKHFRHLLLSILICLLSYAGKAQCAFTLGASAIPVSCAGLNDGAINLTVSGGTGPFTYEWSTNTTQEDISGLPGGIYTVTVTDAVACTATISSTVTTPAAFTVNANDLLLTCLSPSASIVMNITGSPIPPYQWFMSNGTNGSSTSNSFLINSVSAPGTYAITVTNGNGCSAIETVTINQNITIPLANPGTAGTLNCNVTQLQLDGTGSSAGPQFVYFWNALSGGSITSGNNTLTPTVSAPGTYVLTVTNTQNGCTASNAVTVNQDQNSPIAVAGPDLTLTCATTNVALDGSGSSTGGNFSILWSTTNGGFISGANTLSPTVNTPGTYQLLVTNTQNGCTATSIVTVTSDANLPDISFPQEYGLPCGGGNITLPAPAGPGFTYIWTGPAGFTSNFQNPVVSNPGDYTVIVTNSGNGCTSSATVHVYPGPAIPQQNFAVTDLPCSTGSFGAIDMTVDFGTGPYTYIWSNGASTEDINNLTEGTYSITVEDASACSYYAIVSVTKEPSQMVLSLSSTPVTCIGPNTGVINLQVSNGTAPYLYQWSGPLNYTSSLEDPANAPEGTYVVTVTDATGCTKTGTIPVSAAPPISIPQSGIVIGHPGCNGSSNGLINISVQGGVGPFTYDWSNDGPESPDNDPEDLTGMVAGTYTVTVTGANGCTIVSNPFTLIEPLPLQISAVVTHVTCGGPGNDGQINLTVSGAGSPYTYVWASGANTQDLVFLSANTYTVTVTRSNGCTTTRSFNVLNGGTVIAASEFTITPESCQIGASDGAISLNTLPAGAQAPLQFIWQGPFAFLSTQQNISGLPAGIYTLLITDNTTCQYTASITIGKVPADLVLDLQVNYTVCTEGNIDLSVSGGSAPYQYLWSNGSSLEDIDFFMTGDYIVTVTDAGNCTKTASITVGPAVDLNLSLLPTQATCFSGGNNGTIDLTVSGGQSTYSYAWSNTTNTEDQTNLSPGTYCVTVTDADFGCSEVNCIAVTQPSLFGASINGGIPPTCAGSIDGSFSVSLLQNPGAPPYIWDMDGPNLQSGSSATTFFTITSLAAGTYCITVTNADGCTASTCVTLQAPPQLVASIEELSNTCNSAVIRANVFGGTAPFTYSWETVIPSNSTDQIIVAPVSGIYQVLVTDANGCLDFANKVITLANGGNCGYVRGFVIQDDNENCAANINEPGLSGWIVRAEGADTLYGITDALGQYLIAVPNGNYSMAVMPPNNLWVLCPGILQANVNAPNDTVFAGKTPVKRVVDCPALSISIGTAQLRRCFSNNYYYLTYCNDGTAAAINAYVDVTFDPLINFIHSATPSQDLGNNIRRFFIGNVDIGDCDAFNIQVSVSCSAVLGQTHCTEAHIFPDTICNANVQWSGASIDLRSVCSTDSLRFVIKNVGNGDMSESVGYVVVEDAVMVMQAALPLLPAGDSVLLAFPANGSTWRMEVGQEVFHPYPQPASLSVEGCTTGSTFSTGFVNQFPLNDPPPTIDIDCSVNTGSFDPNDKQGYPTGYGAAHYVRPGTEIEYLIRFQNTGTDTAFTVRIIDTLASWLDPATVKFGASSHRYRYDLCGEGVVHFIFDNILLPDSNVNEAASHGFARFSVSPLPSAPLETLIENAAAIYFDYNDPVITNTTFHRLGENFISVGLWQPEIPEATIIATPNPFAEETLLEVKGVRMASEEVLQLQVFDYQGNILGNMESKTGVFHLKKGSWPGGVYLIRITQNGKIVGVGKLIAQ